MADGVDPVSLEGRLGEIASEMKTHSLKLGNVERHLSTQNSRIEKAEKRLSELEHRNLYRDGYSAGRGELSWRDAVKIVALMIPLMGVGLTAIEVLG